MAPSCPDEEILASVVRIVTDGFTLGTPLADGGTAATLLAEPFNKCGISLSGNTVCRYALATRIDEIHAAWNAVQPPVIRKQIEDKSATIKDAITGLPKLEEEAKKAREKADQSQAAADIANAAKAEGAVETAKEKIKALEKERGRLVASLDEVAKSVAEISLSQARWLLGDATSCLSKEDHSDALCRQRRDNALYEADRLLRQAPTTSQETLNKVIKEANDFCGAVASGQNIELAQELNVSVCEWKAEHWQTFIHDFYTLPQAKKPFRIASATFGDHRNGHVCDARAYLQQHCGQLPGTMLSSAGSRSCLVSSITSRTALCGYDPSPQGDLTLRVRYMCGDEPGPAQFGGARSVEVPFTGAAGIGRIDLVCETETLIRAAAVVEDASTRAKRLESLRKFFVGSPCPLTIPEIN